MKSYLIIVVALVSTKLTIAQIENIKIDSTTTINRLYVGLRNTLMLPIDSAENLATINDLNLRVGTFMTQELNGFIEFKTQGAIEVRSSGNTSAFTLFEIITKLNNYFSFELGRMTTPSTPLRRNPITWQGQSETYSESRVIGGRPGVIFNYKPNTNFIASLGLHKHQTAWANHLRVDYKALRIAGYIAENEDYFIGLKYQTQKVNYLVNYANLKKEVSTHFFYLIISHIHLFTDINWKVQNTKSDVNTIGLRRYFKNNKLHLQGFFSMAYSVSPATVSFQTQLHLK
jgi:hypothetical protein